MSNITFIGRAPQDADSKPVGKDGTMEAVQVGAILEADTDHFGVESGVSESSAKKIVGSKEKPPAPAAAAATTTTVQVVEKEVVLNQGSYRRPTTEENARLAEKVGVPTAGTCDQSFPCAFSLLGAHSCLRCVSDVHNARLPQGTNCT